MSDWNKVTVTFKEDKGNIKFEKKILLKPFSSILMSEIF